MNDDLVAITSSLDGKFTIQEDEEQYEKLSQILDLLVSAGYYRAKIQGLGPFDKVVGGMCWCISLCAEAVDVDLLYSESSSIGQKIALTENIVKVLPKFKCPHSIEPHQLQGLDCISIFPVITWLVKEAIEAKKKHGDEILRYSAYQFSRQGWSVDGELNSLRHKPPQRRKRICTRVSGPEEDARGTSFERSRPEVLDTVAHPQTDHLGKEKQTQRVENPPQIDERRYMELTTRLGQDETKMRSVLTTNQEIQQLESTNLELELYLSNLILEEKDQYELAGQVQKKLEVVKQKIEEYDRTIRETDPETLEEAKRLLSECKELRLNEQMYKRECRAQTAKIEEELERLRRAQSEEDQLVEELEDSEQLKELSNRLTELNKEVFYLSRQIDSHPTQIELNQYQRRFVELYNLVTAKHLEARRLCAYYNSLVDTCAFMRREITLLNNIDDQKNLALSNTYKTSFMQNLEEITQGVTENLNKISSKKQEAQQKRDRVADTVQKLQERKRSYHRAIAEFQEECQTNELLLAEEASLHKDALVDT